MMQQTFGICKLSVIPLRAEPSDKSEMISQLLFGDHFEILERQEKWVKIMTAYDEYEGWMDPKQLQVISQEQYIQLNTRLLSGGRDALLNVWDTANFSLQQSIPAHMFTIYDIKFHPSKPYFATASRDKSIKIWGTDDLKLYKIISREKGIHSHHLSINKIAWSKFNENLISVGDDKLIFVWDVRFED